MFKKNRTLKIVAVAAICILLLLALPRIIDFTTDSYEKNDAGPKPTDTSRSNFWYGAIEQICSQEIEGTWSLEKYNWGAGEGYSWEFTPNDLEEMKKYCRDGAVIEYSSVLDILRRDDVGSVIEKYGVEEASARALRHKYIEDKDYLSRILPEYSAENIDCIIVVHSPEGTRFFLENGEVHTEHDDHKYIELASEDFVASLNKAPKQDVIDFWLGLH